MAQPVWQPERQDQGDRQRALPRLISSFKCPDERCLHYIYGFRSQLHRDNHARSHAPLAINARAKRDSGYSISAGPLISPTAPEPVHQTSTAAGHSSRPAAQSGLPPLSLQTHRPKERSESSVSYTFPARAGTRRASIDSESDPILPPLKRSRVTQPRLESIGELNLLRDDSPCLRCRAAGIEVGWPQKRLSRADVVLRSATRINHAWAVLIGLLAKTSSGACWAVIKAQSRRLWIYFYQVSKTLSFELAFVVSIADLFRAPVAATDENAHNVTTGAAAQRQ